MKKLYTSILLLVFAAIAGPAQVKTDGPEGWRVFSPSNEDFTAEVPVDLAKVKWANQNRNKQYANRADGIHFTIFSEKPSEPYETAKALKFIREHQKDGDAVYFGKLKGEKFGFTDDEGFNHRAIYIDAGSWIYLFHVASEERADYAAARFMKGLKVKGQPLSGAGDYDNVPSPVPSDTPKTPEKSGPNGDRPGSGIGDGTGGVKPVLRGIRILTKTAVRYTDLARTYNITGTISLRVEFLADGTIGKVTPVTRLPFGLTNQAIEVAKAIKFEPEMIDGVPHTRTQVIQYSFTIY